MGLGTILRDQMIRTRAHPSPVVNVWQQKKLLPQNDSQMLPGLLGKEGIWQRLTPHKPWALRDVRDAECRTQQKPEDQRTRGPQDRRTAGPDDHMTRGPHKFELAFCSVVVCVVFSIIPIYPSTLNPFVVAIFFSIVPIYP